MSEKQLEKLYYSIYPMNQCETQSKSYEETKELCETLEKEMISLMSPDLQAMFILAMSYAQTKCDARDSGIKRFVRNVQQDL